MKYSNLILLTLIITFNCSLFGQKPVTCDSIYYLSFSNFVNYDDSIGYSLNYKIPLKYQGCLNDTVEIVNFLLTDRFLEQNQFYFKRETNTSGLGNIETSYLAHNTLYKKLSSLPDSLYCHISNWKAQMIGRGNQVVRETPIDVLKFYFISSLYHKNFQFKNEIVLTKGLTAVECFVDKKVDIESPERTSFELKIKNKNLIKNAWKAYLKWQSQLNKLGIEKLRENKINPLLYTRNLIWRNNSNDPFSGEELK